MGAKRARKPSIADETRACLVAPMERLGGLDSFAILTDALEVNAALLDAQSQVAQLRRRAVRDLRAQGYTLQEIATEIGVAPQRIHKIEQGYDRHERQRRADT